MNKERMAYIAPTSELLVVRFEQNIMSGDLQASSGSQFTDDAADVVDGSSSIWW